MNKLDFLRRLDKNLSVLDKEERKEILAFYEERFYNGTIYENKTEEEVIAELENPDAIARNVLEEYGVSPKFVKTSEERYSKISMGQVFIILTFDLLIASWLIPTLFSVTVSLFGSSLTYVGAFSMLVGERTTVDEFVFIFLTGGYILLFLFALVVLEATIFVSKKVLIWHLNVFKINKREKFIKKLSHVSLDAWFKRHRKLKTLKAFALVGALVAISYTGFWIFNHYDWVQAEYGSGEIVNETITEDFAAEITAGDEWDIVTNFGSMDIEIVLVSGDEVTIKHSYYDDDEFTYDFDYENNVLTLENEPTEYVYIWKIEDIIRFATSNNEVRIEVPESLVLNDAILTTSNGEVNITNVDFNSIVIHTSNGEVNISNINLNTDLTVITSNGRIIIQDITVLAEGDLHVESSNGRIEIDNVNFADYVIYTSNGSITLSGLNEDLQDGEDLYVVTSNGSIDMENVYVDEIIIETSNGDIDFYNDDATFMPTIFEKETSNGDINTNVR